jgi:hypothetical protein
MKETAGDGRDYKNIKQGGTSPRGMKQILR